MADILLAAPNAKFGQPEVNIGTITGGGGSQRLARAVGKSRAMELTLTGRTWSAHDAVAWGMASRVVEAAPDADAGAPAAEDGVLPVVREAVVLAREIAAKSQVAVQAQKEAVNTGASSSCQYHSRRVDPPLLLLFSFRAGAVGGSADGASVVPYDFCYRRSERRCVEGFCVFFGLVKLLTSWRYISRHGGLRGKEKAKIHPLVKRLLLYLARFAIHEVLAVCKTKT